MLAKNIKFGDWVPNGNIILLTVTSPNADR